MIKHFPIDYHLESQTHVVVDNVGDNTYYFTLTPAKGPARSFTFVDDEVSKNEVEESSDFERLDAVRTFWLKNTNII